MCAWLTREPLDAARLVALVASEARGATAIFLGTVRCSARDGEVEGIEYSAYDAMAEAEFNRIVAEAAAKWPEARIALAHRVGYVAAGDASIAIAAAAPHRVEAFDACRYVIEETKQRVPIWKKERYVSGAARWVEAPHA